MVEISMAVDRKNRNRKGCAAVAWLLVLVLLLAGIVGSAYSGQEGPQADTQAIPPKGPWRVLRVYDGDTVLVSGGSGQRVVRLLGIDAPETSKASGEPGQPYSRKAQQHLADLILNRSVTLVLYGQDRYQRLLAIVYHGGKDINHAMLRAGLAEVYRGRTPEGFDKTPYLATQRHARRERRGMWRQGAAYTSPLRWKHPS